ncbi:MAG: tetratricopeptide repeat protein [Spirochaetales bacterium]
MNPPVVFGLLAVGIIVLLMIVVSLSRGGAKTKRPRHKDHQTIVKEANRALAQNPKNTEALSALANVYYSEQDWNKAANTYAILLNLVATNPDLNEHEINLRHGLAAKQIGDLDSAYKSLTIARQGHEDLFEITYNLGDLELMRKNYEKAVGLLRTAYGKRPDHPGTIKSLGHAYFRTKKPREAIALLRKVVEAHPDDKESAYLLAQAYHEGGHNDQALRAFGHLRAHPIYGPRASLMAGSLHLKARQYEAAETDFKIGLKHESVPPEISLELKYRLAAAFNRQQKVEEAMQMLQEISHVNPNYKDVSTQLGHTKELAGNRNLQVFTMAPTSEFVGLCRRIAVNYFPRSQVKVTDITARQQDYTDIVAEINTAKWEDTVIFRFVRTGSVVGELVLRDLYSRLKELHAGRGLCVTNGDYSDGAKQFVEARLIDLIDKGALTALLKRV